MLAQCTNTERATTNSTPLTERFLYASKYKSPTSCQQVECLHARANNCRTHVARTSRRRRGERERLPKSANPVRRSSCRCPIAGRTMTLTKPTKRVRSPRLIRCTRRAWCAMDYLLAVIVAVAVAHIAPQVLIHVIEGAR